jgi:hypothetical protein
VFVHYQFPIYTIALQPVSFNTLLVEAGYLFSHFTGRIGRSTKLPPQLGHWFFKTVIEQSLQNVHSIEQITASVDSGGRFLSQHSQLGLSSNIVASFLTSFG